MQPAQRYLNAVKPETIKKTDSVDIILTLHPIPKNRGHDN